RGAGEALVDGRAVDDQRRRQAELGEALRQRAGLGVLHLGAIEHHELAFGLLRRQRGLEREAPDLLLEAVFVAAHDRTEDDRAAAELRRAQRALARAAGPFLLPRLFGRAGDVADALGLVRAGAALGELPLHHARQNVLAHRQAEDVVGDIDVAGGLVVEALHRELHFLSPPAAGLAAGLSLAAFGVFSAGRSIALSGGRPGFDRFAASRTRT